MFGTTFFASFICVFFASFFHIFFSVSFFHVFFPPLYFTSFLASFFAFFLTSEKKEYLLHHPGAKLQWSFRLAIVIGCQTRITCFEIFLRSWEISCRINSSLIFRKNLNFFRINNCKQIQINNPQQLRLLLTIDFVHSMCWLLLLLW